MRKSEVYEAINNNIEHHKINDHMYRPVSGSGRITSSATKDEVIDLILAHLGLKVEMPKLEPTKLVKT